MSTTTVLPESISLNDMDNLIRKIVWMHLQSHPSSSLDFEECFATACLACMEAMPQYDDSKGAQSTFIWTVVHNHLVNLDRKQSRIQQWENVLSEEAWACIAGHDSTEDKVIAQIAFYDMIETLSHDAKMICDIALNPPDQLDLNQPPKKCRGSIVRYLRENGWSWSRIWNAIREVKRELA